MAQQDKEIFKKIKLLGEGAFGKVYLARCLRDDSLYVLKQINL